MAALRAGFDVLIACPGRLEDLAQQNHCKLGAVEACLLDEAGHLADVGFLPAVKRIPDQTPAGGQRMLFSATLDRAVDTLVRRYLTNPVTHSVDSTDATPSDRLRAAMTSCPFQVAQTIVSLDGPSPQGTVPLTPPFAATSTSSALGDAHVRQDQR